MEITKEDLALMWDKRHESPRKHGKYDNLWLGSFVIEKTIGIVPNTFHSSNIEGKPLNYPVNKVPETILITLAINVCNLYYSFHFFILFPKVSQYEMSLYLSRK